MNLFNYKINLTHTVNHNLSAEIENFVRDDLSI